MFGHYVDEDDWKSFDTDKYSYNLVRRDTDPLVGITDTEIPVFLCPDYKKEEAILAWQPGRYEMMMERVNLFCFNHTDAYLKGTEKGFEGSSLLLTAQGAKDCSKKAPEDANCIKNVVFFKDYFVDLTD